MPVVDCPTMDTASNDSPRITVVGEASRWAPADHADVSFTVVRRATDSAQALRAAAATYAELDATLTAHAGVVVRRITTALSVQELTRWEDGRTIHEGFEARRTESARFSPVTGGSVALRAVLDRVRDLFVAGPHFGLDPANPVHEAVRGDAARAARAAAAAYAAGLGLELGGVLALREPGAGEPAPRPLELSTMRAMALAVDGSSGDGTPTLVELTDEDVEVQAAIEAVFALG
jgi:uncharacterized protein YggE